MKTEPDDLMHPFEETDTDNNHYFTHFGLTKRECFAALAMQGEMASGASDFCTAHFQHIAEISVGMADALITELNKRTPSKPNHETKHPKSHSRG